MKARPFFYCLDLELFVCLVDSENINQVDGLGRNAVMYCVHGHSPEHDECLEMLIKANADLNHQATGKNFERYFTCGFMLEGLMQILVMPALFRLLNYTMYPYAK